MKNQSALSLFAGVGGGAAMMFHTLQGATAPAPVQRWEYKVVFCSSSLRNGPAVEAVLTEQLNALAKEGWDYVGSITSVTGGREGAFVTFKRSTP